MTSMWTCFILLCAPAILQSAASDEVVSVKCSDTVEVCAGEDVTLTCRIIDTTGDNCEGAKYQWSNSSGDMQCNTDLKYTCGWDNLTYVYLTISNVVKEENYTVSICTNCGIHHSSVIKVRVVHRNPLQDKSHNPVEPPKDHSSVLAPIVGILVIIAALGVLCFLFRTNRGRQIIVRMKNEKTHEGDGSELEMIDSLTDSKMDV